jgi:hypothetical protein
MFADAELPNVHGDRHFRTPGHSNRIVRSTSSAADRSDGVASAVHWTTTRSPRRFRVRPGNDHPSTCPGGGAVPLVISAAGMRTLAT